MDQPISISGPILIEKMQKEKKNIILISDKHHSSVKKDCTWGVSSRSSYSINQFISNILKNNQHDIYDLYIEQGVGWWIGDAKIKYKSFGENIITKTLQFFWNEYKRNKSSKYKNLRVHLADFRNLNQIETLNNFLIPLPPSHIIIIIIIIIIKI